MSLSSFEVIAQQEPDVAQTLMLMKDKIFRDGELGSKEKFLIAVALGCALKCNTCIEMSALEAERLGASKGEIREAMIVAMYMAGPSAVAWTPKVAEILLK